jgi:galactokinase
MTDRSIDSNPTPTDLETLATAAAQEFRKRFSRSPSFLVAAPGRVNLIGEHTDYNGGYVLPMAIERYVVIAACVSSDRPGGDSHPAARVYSANKDETASLAVDGQTKPEKVTWSNYVQGVIAGFAARGMSPPAFDAVVESTVPLGGGLSSSAALEVATATLLEVILDRQLKPIEKALLCQEAEHKFAGVPCGIMDQFSSTLCTKDHLMLLDCRSQEAQLVPLMAPEITVLIANSNVKHELTGGEYAQRRAQCEAAAKLLGVTTLRDATAQQLESARTQLGDVNYRRARHVIGEIDRTVKAVAAIRAARWSDVGELMYASHDSLRDDYEVSCQELDLLVDIARQIGPQGGVIGSRMTGGGFGGCTVSLVKTDRAAAIADAIRDRYQKSTGIEPTIFTSRPAQGASVLPIAR